MNKQPKILYFIKVAIDLLLASNKWVTPPGDAGSLAHNVKVHKNSFSLQGSKIIKLHLKLLELPIIFLCGNVSQFGFTWV
jgi:hypothetical protein